MAIEDFKHLIEAQSLEKQINTHLEEISAQIKRVQHVEKLRDQALQSANEFREGLKIKSDHLASLEKKLFDAEAKILKTNNNIPLARNEQETSALENELKLLSPLIEELQEEMLELMDEIELIEKSILEKGEFVEGSSISIDEITSESNSIISDEKTKISSLEERVISLLDQACHNYKTAYLLSNEKHQFKNPLCFVLQDACHVCRYVLNQMQAREIEKGAVTESCPGCGRLITPLSAKTI